MMVLHIDAYQAGAVKGFEGSEVYLIACCGMCSFAAMEPVSNASTKTFASALMRIILRYGFCHTVVLDKDSKFMGVFKESLGLLKINYHVLSGDNHNPMLVERINQYLNEGLCIMTNERDSIRIALEAILLFIYAWNSCPVPGTDISLKFSAGTHAELTSAPGAVASYSCDLAERLDACQDIAKLLVREQRCWHRELINARRPDPHIYSVGDIVFAWRATRSNSKRGKVNKLMHPFTGPWCVTRSLSGAYYDLEFASNPKRTQKKHASDLSPYPVELIPFEPLDSADSRYGQLHKPLCESPFKEAGIHGFTPPTPFKAASHFLTRGDFCDFHWPTLAELNDEIAPFPWANEVERLCILSGNDVNVQPILYNGPPPLLVPHIPPLIPHLSTLVAGIITSSDKLFFVLHSLGNQSTREWCLIRVAFANSVSISPSCLQDGRFPVEFYSLHHDNIRFNSTNQCYWLQYHSLGDITTPSSSSTTHFIRPSNTSEAHASNCKLVPFCHWLNLTHRYIHPWPIQFHHRPWS
jgi:hypothetical protein